MKKHTFKSASGSQKIFSPSGTCERTATMAGTPSRKAVVTGRYSTVVGKVGGMSTADFRQTLQRLGISKPNGKLTVKYATKKRPAAAT